MASNYGVALQPVSRSFDTTGDTTERVGFKEIRRWPPIFQTLRKKGCAMQPKSPGEIPPCRMWCTSSVRRCIPDAPTSAWPNLAEQDRVTREQAKAKLEEQLQGVRHEVIFQGGEVYATLNELARDKQADLIVLGTHGRSGLEKVLMGSVAERIFRETRFPVMTVGPKAEEKCRTTAELRRILYATDFSAESLHAAPFAISLARENRAHLILLNCFEGGEDGIQAMLQGLRQFGALRRGVVLRADLHCGARTARAKDSGCGSKPRSRFDRAGCRRRFQGAFAQHALPQFGAVQDRHAGNLPGAHRTRLNIEILRMEVGNKGGLEPAALISL